MKRSVKLSTYSVAVSAICVIVFLVCLYNCRDNRGMYLIGACLILLCGMALLYMPMSISVNDKELSINRPFKIKSIPLKEIKSVKPCPPTMSALRICGSGGWFGYWGWFSEPSIGKYFAYYGKATDCFLITLKDGKKYLLGCEDSPTMVEYIKSKISS